MGNVAKLLITIHGMLVNIFIPKLPYLSLNHQNSLGSHIGQKLVNIQILFIFIQSLLHTVQRNKGTSPTHSCTAVND